MRAHYPALPLLIAAVLVGCGVGGDPAPFDALALLRSGSATTQSDVTIGSVSLYGERRFVVIGTGANVIEFPVIIPSNAILRFGFAILPSLFDKNFIPLARRAHFAVEFVPDGREPVPLYSVPVDIRRDRSQRRWFSRRIDLSNHAGRPGRLRLINGDVGPVPVVWGRPTLVDAVAEGERPNLLFILVDALRSDHLSSYGYARPTTPEMDSLAADGIRFENAFSNAPMTSPSLPQILTSRYSPNMAAPTLATLLFAGGVPVTRAIVNNPWLTTWMMMLSRDSFDALEVQVRGDSVTAAALRWIDERTFGDRFALYVHYLDVHAPYRVPETHAGLFVDPDYTGAIGQTFTDIDGAIKGRYTGADRQHIIDLYDGAIHFDDAMIGRLIDGLETRGLLDSTLVVLTSDHGEEFWERGSFFHGQSLFDEQLHVPLIIRLPGRAAAGRVVKHTARTLDILPTIADILDLPGLDASDGESLLGASGESKTRGHREVFAIASNPLKPLRFAYREPDYKLIVSVEDGSEALYHLAADPRERADVSGEPAHSEALARLRARLDRYRERVRSDWFEVRAVATDGKTHQIDFRVRGLAGLGQPDRIGLPVGDSVAITPDLRSIRWVGTLAAEPRGIRFKHGEEPRPSLLRNTKKIMNRLGFEARIAASADLTALEFDIEVDGLPLAAEAIRLGGGGSPASSPFRYVMGRPNLVASDPPTAAVDGAPVTVGIWRTGSPVVEASLGERFDAEEREQLRELGYAE